MARFILAQDSGWRLEDARQDIRGWPVRDATGRELGTIRSLVADDRTRRVESVVLTNGTEIPARDLDLGNGVVYVRSGRPDGSARRSPYGDARLRRS